MTLRLSVELFSSHGCWKGIGCELQGSVRMRTGHDFKSTVACLASIGRDEHYGPRESPIYRGSATAGERLAAEALTERLTADGWRVQRQQFTGLLLVRGTVYYPCRGGDCRRWHGGSTI
jgi:hypothetical protein